MVKETNHRRSLIPTQVKWDEPGDTVEGRLLDKEETMYQDNVRGRYLVEAADGLKVFMGTFQIDQAMKLVPIGAYIGLTFKGDEGTSKGTRFKTFDIWVDDSELYPDGSPLRKEPVEA